MPLPISQKETLLENPPFGIGIKTVSLVYLWQLNNQRAHHKQYERDKHRQKIYKSLKI